MLESWFGGAEFSQLLLVCKAFDFSFIFQWDPCWYSNLGCRLFSFITLSMSCHSLLAWRVSIERSAVILMGVFLCVICCFSLAAFNICSLCLIFVNLINMGLGVFYLGFILFGTLCVSWTWVIISFPILRKFQVLTPWVLFHALSFCLPFMRLLWFECWGV